jgi:hypothetical protein
VQLEVCKGMCVVYTLLIFIAISSALCGRLHDRFVLIMSDSFMLIKGAIV